MERYWGDFLLQPADVILPGNIRLYIDICWGKMTLLIILPMCPLWDTSQIEIVLSQIILPPNSKTWLIARLPNF